MLVTSTGSSTPVKVVPVRVATCTGNTKKNLEYWTLRTHIAFCNNAQSNI